MLVANGAVVRGNAHTIVGVRVCLVLINEVAYRERMVLGGAEHQGLLFLIDILHEDLNALLLPLFDLNDSIEVGLGVPTVGLYLTFNHVVVRRIDVVVDCGGDLFDLERGQEAVVDAVLE